MIEKNFIAELTDEEKEMVREVETIYERHFSEMYMQYGDVHLELIYSSMDYLTLSILWPLIDKYKLSLGVTTGYNQSTANMFLRKTHIGVR